MIIAASSYKGSIFARWHELITLDLKEAKERKRNRSRRRKHNRLIRKIRSGQS